MYEMIPMLEEKDEVNTDEGLIQKEGADAEMINVQQGNENLETTLNQVIKDAHVTLSTVTKKTKVPVTSSSHSSDLASKFLNFSDIPHTDAEIVSPMDVHVHHEILPKEVSNFASLVIKSMVTESLEHAVLAKESSQPKSTYEVADSDMPQDQEENLGNDDEEPKRKVASKHDWHTYQYVELEYDFEECYKDLSEKLDWDNPKGGDYPFDLTKPLPLVMNENHQMVPVDYFFNNDLKYLQGGILTMTYTTSITKTKAAQYDIPGIKDMVRNIWSPVKVAYDKHALWGISHWRDQRKTFYGYAQGLESTHDVYSTNRILAVTRVEVMRKHGYGSLREIEVRRADNDLYTFKEGDFQRLRINDSEDMLILIVQNRLTNLSGDDVFEFL
ncbi:hypothetical protein Tco_0987670 [Tanacetum coccineum]